MQGRPFQTIVSLAIYVDINGLGCFKWGRRIQMLYVHNRKLKK